MTLLLIGGLGMGEVLVIALVVLLLFGGKKIPELMRGLGQGVKAFKDGANGIADIVKDEDKTPQNTQSSTSDATSEGSLSQSEGAHSKGTQE